MLGLPRKLSRKQALLLAAIQILLTILSNLSVSAAVLDSSRRSQDWGFPPAQSFITAWAHTWAPAQNGKRTSLCPMASATPASLAAATASFPRFPNSIG